jgi:hypothetical protein
LNKIIIGFGYGLIKNRHSLLTKEFGIDPQIAMNFLSFGIGREIMKEIIEQEIAHYDDPDEKLLNALVDVLKFAEELDIKVLNEKIKIVIQKCLICPKRIGGYDLEGKTACPIGGIITGALSYTRKNFPDITKNKLEIAEICHIEMDYNSENSFL